MKKVLITDPLHKDGIEILRSHPESFEIEICEGLSAGALEKKVIGAEILLIRAATKISRDIIDSAKKLELICQAANGTDNIDLKAAQSKNIKVMNVPAASAIATAELTIGLLLAVARNVSTAHTSLKNSEWNRKAFMGLELAGQTLGIIGFGRIGRLVAVRLKAFGMHVIATDPYIEKSHATDLGVELVSMDHLLQKSDVVTVHTPLTDETRGLLGHANLGLMKPSAILLNCARGGIVDEGALLDSLNAGRLAGYGVDVFEKEPFDFAQGAALIQHPKVVATPHIGAQTSAAQRKISTTAAEQLVHYFKTGEVRNLCRI